MSNNRNNKRFIAINTHLFLSILIFVALVCISISCAIESEMALAIGFGIVTLLPVFVFLTSPIYFIFDDDAVKIVYHFGQTETILWNSVRRISLMGSWILEGGGPPHYVFDFPRKEKRLFFVLGEIPKTRRTKKLIKRFYKKEIR